MGRIDRQMQFELQDMFGNRISFRRLERKLYGHDIAAVPSLIKPFIGHTLPDAVVQPQTEQELIWLVRWAVKH
jgi:FAD/FMN-containing dehydrogenase